MPIETVPGTDLKYYLTVFDKDGRERPEDDGAPLTSQVVEQVRRGDVTDVFFVSHGWKGDVPAARDQYNRWIKATATLTADLERVKQQRPGFTSLIVGLHWPSQPWGDEEIGGAGVSFGPPSVPVESLIERYADRIADTPLARAALSTIFAAARTQIHPPRLSDEVRKAYEVLNQEAGLGSAGEGAAPGDDREPFDPDRAYAFSNQEAASFGGAGLGGILSPLRQLSFWKMKDRARAFGESGAHQLLRAVQQAGTPHVHCMGHSFGCIVISAMLAGPPGGGQLPSPVDSAALVQGALSLWSFCESVDKADGRPGYFNSIVKQRKVRGPMITTQSKRDTAVGRFYPLAAGVARQVSFGPGEFPKYGGLGAFGAQGPGAIVEDLRMRGVNETYNFKPGVIYNLEGTHIISEGAGASGAHSDIAKPEVAHAFWEAVAHAR